MSAPALRCVLGTPKTRSIPDSHEAAQAMQQAQAANLRSRHSFYLRPHVPWQNTPDLAVLPCLSLQPTCFICSATPRKHKQAAPAALAQPHPLIKVRRGQLHTAGGACSSSSSRSVSSSSRRVSSRATGHHGDSITGLHGPATGFSSWRATYSIHQQWSLPAVLLLQVLQELDLAAAFDKVSKGQADDTLYAPILKCRPLPSDSTGGSNSTRTVSPSPAVPLPCG
jgi:hypothetical protein